MYEGAVAGMYLFGIYGSILLFAIIIGWSDGEWSDRLGSCVVLAVLIIGFLLCWHAKIEVFKREPVISSCFVIYDGGRTKYQMVDSTLRCKTGESPRYTVVKTERRMEPNEQTPCLHCGKTLIHHRDSSCRETEQELEVERMIDYMNSPL